MVSFPLESLSSLCIKDLRSMTLVDVNLPYWIISLLQTQTSFTWAYFSFQYQFFFSPPVSILNTPKVSVELSWICLAFTVDWMLLEGQFLDLYLYAVGSISVMDINRSLENRSCFYHEVLLSSRQIKFLVPLDIVGCFLKPISCLPVSTLPGCQCCDFCGFSGANLVQPTSVLIFPFSLPGISLGRC